MGDAFFGRLPLGGGLEGKFVDLPHGQALCQKIKRAVFGPVAMTVTVGLAAAGKAFHQGSAQAVGRELQLGEQPTFALAQGEGRLAGEVMNLCHMYGIDSKITALVNQ